MRVSLRKWGNSLAMRIPKSIASEAGVEDGAIADLSVERGAMVARLVAPSAKLPLARLLRKVTKQNVHREISTGKRRGREIW
jgi:antitoxin MazE